MVPFFSVHCRQLPLQPRLHGVCAGYESGKWRADQLSRHLMDWLPEFSLSYSERESINHTNLVSQLRKAAQIVYDTDKYDRRGEFGELILHALMRETIGTQSAISKIYFKDAVNNTVKGFDAVHVLATETALELWLGEVKFYKDIGQAIKDVVPELEAHFQDDYLKKEFVLIANKLDPNWDGTQKVKDLLHRNRSLDEVVTAVVVPVLLTYDSATVKNFSQASQQYKAALETELAAIHQKFVTKNKVTKVRIELFLFPMASKDDLLDQLHKRLKAAQDL
jgi:Cap4 SAVED domain